MVLYRALNFIKGVQNNMKKRKTVISVILCTLIIGVCGVYITSNNNTVTIGDVVGSNSEEFAKIEIYKTGKYKIITDKSEISDLLNKLSAIQLKKSQTDPNMDGGTYSVKFYPSDGSGSFTLSDGGNGKFSKEKNCNFRIPEGWCRIKKGTSYDTGTKTMNYYFDTVSGTVHSLNPTAT
jgi:hypothetical protein